MIDVFVSPPRLELGTNSLKGYCSTIELRALTFHLVILSDPPKRKT